MLNAYLSILFAINAKTDIHFKGRRGRPSLNLLDMIRKKILDDIADNTFKI